MLLNDLPPSPSTNSKSIIIVVQSQSTLVIGLLMLCCGILIGYWLHPVFTPPATPAPTSVAQIVVTVVVPTVVSPNTTSVPTPTAPSSALPQTSQTQTESVMSVLNSQTRHFKGNPDAPVTIIEFSDFQ